MRTILKIFKITLFTFVLLVLAGIGYSIIYQDKIVNAFVTEANKHLITPINVGKIHFSVLEKFPNMAIVMNDVYIGESLPDSKDPLAVSNKVYLTFSILNLLKGAYVIDQIILEDAEVRLRITKEGHLNYIITKNEGGNADNKVKFDIEKINLQNVQVTYTNERKNEIVDLKAKESLARLSQSGSQMSIALEGTVFSEGITIDKRTYFHQKSVELNTEFTYEVNEQVLTFDNSSLHINGRLFMVNGTYLIAKNDEINLKVSSEKTDLQTIMSVLPPSVEKYMAAYKSEGDIYFNSFISGTFGRNISPGVSINFGCNNATFIYPENNKRINNVFLEGEFNSNSVVDLSKADLNISKIEGKLDGQRFTGNLRLQDLDNPYMDCQLIALLDVQSFLAFFPVSQIRQASGQLDIDINLHGKISDFKRPERLSRVDSKGEVGLKDVNFQLNTNTLLFQDLNGHFLFSNNDLAINDFHAKAGKSSFTFNGYFKNFLAQLFSKDQPLVIQAKLNSQMIDLDELLSSEVDKGNYNGNQPVKYFFDITPRLSLQFNCDIRNLKFRRFRGKKIQGDLWVKNQQAWTRNLSFQAAGGNVKLSGKVDARPKNDLMIETKAQFDHISVDSTFYIFENFNQNWLEDRHLKGQFYSDVTTKLSFNKNLKWYPNSLEAKVFTSIKNGELNNFEPMKQVAGYIRKEKLDHLRFSEIQNIITIRNKEIIIPPMEVSSNVRTIQVSGTHTFDQHINYDLKIPLSNHDNRYDKDEAFGAIENTNNGESNLFLTITGTTSDYNIVYNTRAVKTKIKNDLKKEGQELKTIFENQGKPKETIELNEEEYFDFDSVESRKTNQN